MFEPSPQCRLRVEADSPNISSVLVGESGCGFGVAFCFVQASSCFFLFTFAKILCSPICRNFFQRIGLFLQRICLLSLFCFACGGVFGCMECASALFTGVLKHRPLAHCPLVLCQQPCFLLGDGQMAVVQFQGIISLFQR